MLLVLTLLLTFTLGIMVGVSENEIEAGVSEDAIKEKTNAFLVLRYEGVYLAPELLSLGKELVYLGQIVYNEP